MLLFFFLIIDLYFLILTVIAQIVNPFAELVIPIGIHTKEEKGEMETHPVIVEGNIRIKFRVVEIFLCFLLINLFLFISSIK